MNATFRLKNWFCNRPTPDANTSAVWFLTSFVYMQGISKEETGFSINRSGLVPVVDIPYADIVMVWVCLAIASVVLVEPVLPSALYRMTTRVRESVFYRAIFALNAFTAFTLGLLAGIVTSIEKLYDSPWIVNLIAVLGFCIFLAVSVKFTLHNKRNLYSWLHKPSRPSGARTPAPSRIGCGRVTGVPFDPLPSVRTAQS